YEEAMALARAIREEFAVQLRSIGIKAVSADDQRLFETLWRWFNPDKPVSRYLPPGERPPYGSPDYEGLTAQLAKTEVDNAYSTRIFVGNTWISGMAMGVSPDVTSTGFVDKLLRMDGEFYLVVDWYHRETASEVRKLSTTLRTATAMTRADTVVDPGVFVKAENYSEALKRVQGEGRQIFDVAVHLIFLSRDEKEVVRKLQEARGRFAELGGVRGIEVQDFFEAWVSVSPGSGRVPYYKAKLLEDNAADFMPTWSPWRGLEKPVAVYEG
ncbi:hypothetical protein CSW50_08475, partial [Thermus scotoductus]